MGSEARRAFRAALLVVAAGLGACGSGTSGSKQPSDAGRADARSQSPDGSKAPDTGASAADSGGGASDRAVAAKDAPAPDGAGGTGDLPPPPPDATAETRVDARDGATDMGGPKPDATPPVPDATPPGPDAAPLPPLPSKTGPGSFAIPGRSTTAIEVVVPTNVAAHPPLVISFHPTGGSESEAISQFQLDSKAVEQGFIAIAPRAGYRNGQHPADVDHDLNGGDSSWNMWDLNPATNEDLRYVVALIDAAQQTYGADTSRVYTLGFSNGAFFSYFVAMSLPSRIAGFGENSGGWTTDACPTRYGAESDGLSYMAQAAPAGVGVGGSFACSVVFAAAGFPSVCRTSATNHLRPPAPGARVPFGYLAHYSSDSIVSVQWSCIVAEALGARVQATIRYSDPDIYGGAGSVIQDHNVMPDFFDKAWAFFARRTNAQ